MSRESQSSRTAALMKIAIGCLLVLSPIALLQVWSPLPPSDPQAREVKARIGFAIGFLEVLAFAVLWQSRKDLKRWQSSLVLVPCVLAGLVALMAFLWAMP